MRHIHTIVGRLSKHSHLLLSQLINGKGNTVHKLKQSMIMFMILVETSLVKLNTIT